jgi:hypothetical protein
MASDNWHHLEGTVPRPGIFRLYLYDNFTRPMKAAGFKGALVRDTLGPDGVLGDGDARLPLAPPNSDSDHLEAAIPDFVFPFHAHVLLSLGGKEERFDFAFHAPSAERLQAPPEPATPSTAAKVDVPATLEGIVTELRARELRVRLLIHEGRFRDLYAEALAAKDLALALEDALTRAGKYSTEGWRAARDVVRSAWLLDYHGDLGNRQGVVDSFRVFHRGIAALSRLVPVLPEVDASE